MNHVVIDFEATCDEPYNPEPQEIIEFPAVVVDPELDIVSAEFHEYVRPVAHPRLTSFCVGLTGICQEQVDEGRPFPEVLGRFEEWLQQECPDDALMVTCGDWDLGSLLPRQCAQHGLTIPGWARRWANLKRVFASHFPQVSGHTGLVEMARSLGLPLVGRLHSGIDDARNLARVLLRMLSMGVSVGNTAFWRCQGCGAENPHHGWECGRCGQSRAASRPGDWACLKCGFGNFASRDRCFDCGTPRLDGAGPASTAAAMKPGDWLCPRCGGHNFARRRNCFDCGSARR
jgi:inhibitor of KinA sporulation pathway (predicted exonuclease)